MRRDPVLLLAFALVLAQAAAAALAPLVAPYGPNAQDILARLQGPSRAHWLGTDNFGRDVLARIVFGYRTLFAVSAGSVLGALLAGGGLGRPRRLVRGPARSYRDATDGRAVRLPDHPARDRHHRRARPGGGQHRDRDRRSLCADLRSHVCVRRHCCWCGSEYVAAARAVGAGGPRILLRHVLPNLSPVILVQASLSLSTAILVEASLSFLGLGTQPPTASLGRMLSESRAFLVLSPWPAVFSGAAILLASLGFNLLGDGLQDQLDPRLRSG